jgi:plasmid stabilization system protein ParE
MAGRFKLVDGALDDIESIWDFIASDSFKAANRVESAILSACKTIARSPNVGVRKTDLTLANVRFMPVSRYPNYMILYIPDSKPVQILAVIHGNRDMKSVLRRLCL